MPIEVSSDPNLGSDKHIWIQELLDGRVRIGLDRTWAEKDVLVTGIELPPSGTTVKCDSTLFRLRIVTKICTDTSCTYVPSVRSFNLSHEFEVNAVNAGASSDPALLQEDPLGRGWLLEGILGARRSS